MRGLQRRPGSRGRTCQNCCCSGARQSGSARQATSEPRPSRLSRSAGAASTSSVGGTEWRGGLVGWWAGGCAMAGRGTRHRWGQQACPVPGACTPGRPPAHAPYSCSAPRVMASSQSSSHSASSRSTRARRARCPSCLACARAGGVGGRLGSAVQMPVHRAGCAAAPALETHAASEPCQRAHRPQVPARPPARPASTHRHLAPVSLQRLGGVAGQVARHLAAPLVSRLHAVGTEWGQGRWLLPNKGADRVHSTRGRGPAPAARIKTASQRPLPPSP